MMGVQAASAQLFYDFCLDDHVLCDHLLRSIDGHLDFEGLRQTLKPFYSQIRRPSIDPELMIRMFMVGCCMGIRSQWRLCEEVHLNLAYRWSAGSAWTARFPITRRSQRTDTAAFARAICCVICLRASFNAAWQRGWWAPADLRSTQASSPPTPTSSARFQARTGSLRRSRRPRFALREYLFTLDDAAFGAAPL
jgi:transposase